MIAYPDGKVKGVFPRIIDSKAIYWKKEQNDMVSLTIYTEKFDSLENVHGKGMSGKVFIEDNNCGQEFNSLDDALDYLANNPDVNVDQIACNYLSNNGTQCFKKFNTTK